MERAEICRLERGVEDGSSRWTAQALRPERVWNKCDRTRAVCGFGNGSLKLKRVHLIA
jgi:hypothetical protein